MRTPTLHASSWALRLCKTLRHQLRQLYLYGLVEPYNRQKSYVTDESQIVKTTPKVSTFTVEMSG